MPETAKADAIAVATANQTQNITYAPGKTGTLKRVFTLQNPNVGVDSGSGWYGWDVDLSGTRAVIGHRYSDTAGNSAGEGHVYDFSGVDFATVNGSTPTIDPTSQTQPEPFDSFGWAVAISDDRVAMSALFRANETNTQGYVYMYDIQANGSLSPAVLSGVTDAPSEGRIDGNFGNPPNGTDIPPRFGSSIAVWNNDWLFSAPGNNTGGVEDSGAAYLIRDNGSGFDQNAFYAPEPQFDGFMAGNRPELDLSEEYAVLGFGGRDAGSAIDVGAAYVHIGDTGYSMSGGIIPSLGSAGLADSGNPLNSIVQAADSQGYRLIDLDRDGRVDGYELLDPVGTSADRLGNSVAVLDNFALISSPGGDSSLVDSGNNNAGKAFLFDLSTASLLHTFESPNAGGNFGSSVAMSDDYFVIGDHSNQLVYVYDATDYALLATLDNPTGITGDRFGISLEVDGDLLLVSAYETDVTVGLDTLGEAGVAYLYNLGTFSEAGPPGIPTPATLGLVGLGLALAGLRPRHSKK